MIAGRGQQAIALLRSKIVSDVVWTSVGSVVYLGSQWLTLVLVARLLGEQALGEFSLALAVTSPIVLLTRMQLRTVQATDAAKQWTFEDYLRVSVAGGGVGLGIGVGVLTASGVGAVVVVVGLILLLGRMAETASEAVYGELQRRHEMRQVANAYMVKGGVVIACVAGSVVLGGGVAGVGIGLLVAWVTTFFGVDLRRVRTLAGGYGFAGEGSWKVVLRKLKPLVVTALPLGGIALLSSLKMNAPKYALALESGEISVGVFTALAYFLVVGGRANLAIGHTVIPVIATHLAGGRERKFKRWVGAYLLATVVIGLTAILVAYAWGEDVLALVFGSAYGAYAPVLVIVMFAGLAEYLAGSLRNLLITLRAIHVQLPITVASLVICFALSAVLVPEQGLIGAAFAFGVALGFEALGYAIALAVQWHRLPVPSISVHA
jgi:O-antigen/teichoic acid export membrane protein